MFGRLALQLGALNCLAKWHDKIRIALCKVASQQPSRQALWESRLPSHIFLILSRLGETASLFPASAAGGACSHMLYQFPVYVSQAPGGS